MAVLFCREAFCADTVADIAAAALLFSRRTRSLGRRALYSFVVGGVSDLGVSDR